MRTSTKAILAAFVASAVVGIVMAVAGRSKTEDTEPEDENEGGDPPGGTVGLFQNTEKVIAVGESTDPKVAPLLAEIRQLWQSKGIDLSYIDPVQFYTMSKAPLDDGPDEDDEKTRPMVIPPRATWARTADFIADVLVPVLKDMERRGTPRKYVRIGGFRAHDYNAAVGGAKNSRHVDGDSADIIPMGSAPSGTVDDILMAIFVFRERHKSWPIGAGAYAYNGHIDIGHPNRDTWSGKTVPGKDDKYIAKAKNELAIS